MLGVSALLRKLLYSILVVVVLGAIATALLFGTSSGRGLLAEQLERFTDERIPGSMKIGEIESIDFLAAVATDVAFYHPSGQRVLYVRRARVVFALGELVTGKLGFEKARADGGEVVIDIGQNGRVTIEEAFKGPEADEESVEEKVKLELHNMHFEGMQVVMQMSGETRFVLDGVRGFMSVWRRDTPGVRVTLGEVEGVFQKPEIFGNTLVLENMEGEVWAQEDHVVSMKLETKLGNGAIDASLDYYKHPERKARLRLQTETGSGANLVGVGTNVRSWFSDKLEVSVE